MGDDNFIVYNKNEMTDFFSKVLQLNDRIKCVYTTKSKQDIYRAAEVIKISNKTITINDGGKERILKKEHITELDKIETELQEEEEEEEITCEECKTKINISQDKYDYDDDTGFYLCENCYEEEDDDEEQDEEK